MNLFFAYVLATCPVLNDFISVLMLICGGLVFLAVVFYAQEDEDNPAIPCAKKIIMFGLAALAVLTLLWVLVPSQKRLNAMMLNYHAGCVDVRDEYGVQK